MTETMTAERAIRSIQTSAEDIKSNAPQRFPEAASPGESFRQGDIYITLLGAVPKGCTRREKVTLQLAEGDTQGSRHCLDSAAGVTMYYVPGKTELDGPVLDLAEERTITHPEHGHVTCPPGVYGVRYQRDLDEQEREQRVVD